MLKYKLGDRVKIVPGTEYENQSEGGGGKIIVADRSFDDYHYRVEWDCGGSNTYRDRDLMYESEPVISESDTSLRFLSKDEVLTAIRKRYGIILFTDTFNSDFRCDGSVKTTDSSKWYYYTGSTYAELYLAGQGNGGCRIYNYNIKTGETKWAKRANLPQKWQVYATGYGDDHKKISEWRKKCTRFDHFSGEGYVDETGYFRSNLDSGRAIITHEEFMKWVYDPKFKESKPDLWTDPGSLKVWKIIANRDISHSDLDCAGSIPFIPKGTVLWIDDSDNQLNKMVNRSGNIYPFQNKWSANIPASYFDFHPDNPYPEPKPQPEPEASPKFKVGDKVRAINETHGWGPVDFGDIGTISEFYGKENGTYKYFVDFPTKTYWVGYEKCFELVEASSSTGTVVSIHEQSSTFTKNEHPYIKDVVAIDVLVVKPKKSNRLTI